MRHTVFEWPFATRHSTPIASAQGAFCRRQIKVLIINLCKVPLLSKNKEVMWMPVKICRPLLYVIPLQTFQSIPKTLGVSVTYCTYHIFSIKRPWPLLQTWPCGPGFLLMQLFRAWWLLKRGFYSINLQLFMPQKMLEGVIYNSTLKTWCLFKTQGLIEKIW